MTMLATATLSDAVALMVRLPLVAVPFASVPPPYAMLGAWLSVMVTFRDAVLLRLPEVSTASP